MLNPIANARQEQYLKWLLELTQVPTASGREWRVVEWIKRWTAERPALECAADKAGNLVVAPKKPWGSKASCVFITAHLDHPGFVVERLVAPGVVELTFRGGVMDVYFEKAQIVIHAGGREGRPETRVRATVTGVAKPEGPLGRSYLADLDHAASPRELEAIAVGDVATWALPPAEVDARGLVHTHACDDLAALAAAVSAMDALTEMAAKGDAIEDVRLLFTRAEEIGFTGAIAACKLGTMPEGSRVVALENSRSFADSPIGSGPIVRVGDRLTIFDPNLTAACAKRAEEISGHACLPTEGQTNKAVAGWRWQRKLMPGGACEATVYCAYGYAATCLCLPLGNYHNMADLAVVQDGTYDRARSGPPRVGREYIHKDDYLGLVDLLIAIGQNLPEDSPMMSRMESLYGPRAFVLDEV